MKNILVALELNDEEMSNRLVEEAARLALVFNAKCWLIHIAAPDPDFVGYDVGPQYIRDLLAEDLKEDHKKIQSYSQKLKQKNVNAEGLMIQGPTVESIIDEVQKLEVDLLVLGNKHHGILYSTFVGSVTEDIFEKVSIPVYLVPDKK